MDHHRRKRVGAVLIWIGALVFAVAPILALTFWPLDVSPVGFWIIVAVTIATGLSFWKGAQWYGLEDQPGSMLPVSLGAIGLNAGVFILAAGGEVGRWATGLPLLMGSILSLTGYLVVALRGRGGAT